MKEYEELLNQDINEKTGIFRGGRTKISLIRLLLKAPDVLILDESTSSFYLMSIETFKSVIDEIKKDKIIFMITNNRKLMEV